MALLLGGCGGDVVAPPEETDATGNLLVMVSTTGGGSDPDGYLVTVGSRTGDTGADGTVLFEGLDPGSHTVELTGLADNCLVSGDATAAATVVAGATAEVAFDVQCGLWQIVACPGLSLEADSGTPLDPIAIGSLPASLEPPVAAAISVEGQPTSSLALIEVWAEGEGEPGPPTLIVPLHPVTPLEGGTVELTVSDAVRACEPVSFEIQPLPEAPGELAAVVDLLQQRLSAQATELGTTTEDLVSTPLSDLPHGLWPLALAQTALDHPDSPESLRAMADGALGTDALDLLDRILARTTLRATLAAASAAAPTTTAQAPAASAEAPEMQILRASAIGCDQTILNGSTPLALHNCMVAAADAKKEISSISRRVKADIGNAMVTLLEKGGPVGEGAASALGYAAWVLESETQKAAALYPSRFTHIDVGLSHHRFKEDDPATGTVDWVNVWATSDGYDLQKEILDGFREATGTSNPLDKFGTSVGSSIDDQTNRLRGTLEAAAGDTELDIEPELFGPVNVGVPDWTDMDVVAGESIQLGPELEYKAWIHGSSNLEIRTEDGMFGGQQIAKILEVTVGTISIVFTPADTLVPASHSPHEVIEFDVKVEDAHFPDRVDIDLSYTVQGDADTSLDGPLKVYYVPPENPVPSIDDWVAIRYIGKTGARANGPERVGKARIRFAEITISPRGGCLEPGDTLRFDVEAEGLGDETVEWSADVGSITADGLYTAPTTPPGDGTATITAVSTENRLVRDEVDVRVGGCSCGFSVTVEGETFTGTSGDEMVLAVDGSPVTVFGVDIADAGLSLQLRWDPLSLGATGTVQATVLSGTFWPLREWFGFATAPGQTLTMDVTVNDGDLFAAEFSGPITLQNQDGQERIGVMNGWFNVRWDSDNWQTGGNRCSVE